MDSLIGQTLRNIEIICIDDGSSDNSGKILDEYAAVSYTHLDVYKRQAYVFAPAQNAPFIICNVQVLFAIYLDR